MWLVVILTGLGVGLTGGWLDVLVKWYVFCFISIRSNEERCCRLGDLREGRCTYGFFYNQVACCSDLKCECRIIDACAWTKIFVAGEACTAWLTWGEYLSVDSVLAQSLLHSFVYVSLAVSGLFMSSNHSQPPFEVAFAGSAAVLVKSYAPYAFHTGSELFPPPHQYSGIEISCQSQKSKQSVCHPLVSFSSLIQSTDFGRLRLNGILNPVDLAH